MNSHKLTRKELLTSNQVQQITDELPQGKSKVYIKSTSGYYCIEASKKEVSKYIVKFFESI